VVADYDEAIRFFVDVLDFELVEDSPSLTSAAAMAGPVGVSYAAAVRVDRCGQRE
jgi:catechol 2,3-dioxygenase-like lactoylglutathione lyase family enzyme